MPAPRSSTHVSTFAPVLFVGFALATVLFLTPHSSMKPEDQPAHQLVLEGDQESVYRIQIKNGIVEDLLAGILTWNEAVERIIEVSEGSPAAQANLKLVYPEGTTREQAARQLLTYASIRHSEQPNVHDTAMLAITELAKVDVGEFDPTNPDHLERSKRR